MTTAVTEAAPLAISESDMAAIGFGANMKMAPGLALFMNPALYAQAKAVALRMSEASGLLGAHLIGKPSTCMAILSRSITWNLDPFAVAQSTYEVSGKIGYEGKLVQAILENCGALEGRITYRYEGPWEKLRGKFKFATVNGKKVPQQLWEDSDEEEIGRAHV